MTSLAIGTDGAAVFTESPLVRGWETATSLQTIMAHAEAPLPEFVKTGLEWTGAKLPAELLKKVLGTIHEFPHTETGYMLLYRISDNSWRVHCPAQSGNGGAVHFEDDRVPENMEGYAVVGTIHTHPEMSAFWSGTDLHDQRGKRGVHIVFGLHDGLVSGHLCTIFSIKSQYDVPLWSVCEEVPLDQVYPSDPEWVDVIKQQKYAPAAQASSSRPYGSWSLNFDDDTALPSAFPAPRRRTPARDIDFGAFREPKQSDSSDFLDRDVQDILVDMAQQSLSLLLERAPEAAKALLDVVLEDAGMRVVHGQDSEPAKRILDLDGLLWDLTEAAEEETDTLALLDDTMALYGYSRNMSPTDVLDSVMPRREEAKHA